MLTGKTYSFDEALLVGLPGALSKKPDERSGFDSMVLSAFESQVMRRIAEAETSIAGEMPGREERAAVVHSARLAHESLKERQTSSLDALTAAQAMLREGEIHVQEAQRSVQSLHLEVQEVMMVKQHAQIRLADFRKGPFSAFQDLRTGSASSHAVIAPEIASVVSAVGSVAEATAATERELEREEEDEEEKEEKEKE